MTRHGFVVTGKKRTLLVNPHLGVDHKLGEDMKAISQKFHQTFTPFYHVRGKKVLLSKPKSYLWKLALLILSAFIIYDILRGMT